MKYIRLTQIFALLAAFVLVSAGAGTGFAQGKGKGGGKQGGGQQGGGNGGGGKHGGGNPGKGNDKRASMPAPQPGGGWQVVQQQRGNGKGRGMQNQIPVHIQRQAPAYYPQYNPQVYAQGNGKVKGNGKFKANKANKDGGVQYQPQIPVLNGGYKNYGQQRKAEVHARNAERKALKEDLKADRRYSAQLPYYVQPQQRYSGERRYTQVVPNYGQQTYTQPYYQQQQAPYYQQRQQYPVYQQPYYGGSYSQPYFGGGYSQPYYGQSNPIYSLNDGNGGIGSMLRNMIFSVIADKAGLNQGYYPQTSYGYGQGYSPQAGYGYGQGYTPVGYSGYSPYSAYGPAPYTASYPAMGGYYAPEYSNQYGYGDELPVHLLMTEPGLGGQTGEMFTQLLALGYEQGYQRGLTARQARARDQDFYDPYAYNNDAYDPYSISLGDNRRFLSQGYELGYEDALNNVDDYQRVAGNGGVDLVSLLIGTVSQLI